MPPKKQFLKPNAKQNKKPADPNTENEFLEAADEFEKAAGKWRAGDAAKSMRFFQRAVDAYDAGLKKHPASFDLAYNKALLQYQITQDDRIAPKFGDEIDLLRETLQSHRYALGINQDNPDVLFNTAQVLSSLAERLDKSEGVPLLEEAIELLSSCLSRQELEYNQMQTQMEEAGQASQQPAEEGEMEMEEAPEGSEQPEQWASVIEPVTPDALLETALAQLGALTSLLGMVVPSLPAVSQIASPLIDTKIPYYLSLISDSPSETVSAASTSALSISASTAAIFTAGTETTAQSPRATATAEAALGTASYTAARLDAEFRDNLILASDYLNQLNTAFDSATKASSTSGNANTTASADTLCAHADALIDFASTVAEVSTELGLEGPKLEDAQTLRWTSLARAQELLTQASSTATPDSKPTIYLARGDIDIWRYRLASSPSASPALAQSAATLLKNAGVYWRGAERLAQQVGDEETGTEARVKGAVMAALAGDGVQKVQGVDEERVQEVVGEMVDEGMLDEYAAVKLADVLVGK